MKNPTEDKEEIKKKYGRHVDHRTSWLGIAQKKLPELGGQSVLEYVKENTDLKDPSMFIASLFEEGLAKRINENNQIGRDGKNGMTVSGDYDYPYSGYFDFGLDTIGTKLDDFVKKGYLKDDIKDRIKFTDVLNEKGENIKTGDFKDFKDVLDTKLAYLKESETALDKYISDKGIPLSDDAKEYFKYVGYNTGVGNAQGMINSFNEKGYLEEDKFLKDDFEPEYWKDPYKNSMRRWQGADMMRNEFDLKPIDRTFETPVDVPERVNPDLMRTEAAAIDAPVTPMPTTQLAPVQNQGIQLQPQATVQPTGVQAPIDNSNIENKRMTPASPLQTEDFMFGGALDAGTNGAGIAGMAGGLLGGLIPTTKKDGTTSIGGSTASGAIKGAASGAMLGPPGMIIGAALGGLTSFLGAKKEREGQLEQKAAQHKQDLTNYISGSNLNQGNGSNLPMAMGGPMGSTPQMRNPALVEFNEGGTHEQNPLGGIPQGMNQNGKMRTVEEGETKYKFKQGDYVFSNRLGPSSYEF